MTTVTAVVTIVPTAVVIRVIMFYEVNNLMIRNIIQF